MKPSIKYGLINAGLGILWAMLMYVTGLNKNDSFAWIQFLSMIIPIYCITMAVKAFRESNNGYINFGQAFGIGFTITAIGAVAGGIWHFLYLRIIDPGYLEYQLNQQVVKLQERGMADDAIESQMKVISKWMTPEAQFGFAILVGIIFSAFLSLIMAAILKKPNPEEIS